MRTIFSITIITVFLTISCSENKIDYLSKGEKLFNTSQNDKVKIEKAIEYFKKELLINPDSRIAAINLATAYSNISKSDSAIIIFSSIIKSNEMEMATLYQGRGMNRFIMKDYKGSIDDFENAIKYYGGNVTIYKQLVLSKIWMKFNKNGVWLDFKKEDVAVIINKVYPNDFEKPSVEEFSNVAK